MRITYAIVHRMAARGARVSMVDPRDRRPCLKELEVIYAEQLVRQREAVERVEGIGREVERLLDGRMKELSANDMDVFIFDTKRNPSVFRGRREKASTTSDELICKSVGVITRHLNQS